MRLIKKFINQWTHPSLLYPRQSSLTFPNQSVATIRIAARLRGIKKDLQNRPLRRNLGALYTIPHKAAAQAYRFFIDQNPNHLGNWSNKEPKYETQQLEYEVIKKMIHLYDAKEKELEGYITSGGTEGNLLSVWMGRSYLEKRCSKNSIRLIQTSLTHYSIKKASAICNIPLAITPLDDSAWNMHPSGLEETVKNLYNKGARGFLLPLTLGYTSTGTADNISSIIRTIKKIQKRYKTIHFFVWVDAALDGLIYPFSKKPFTPFSSPFIQTWIVDFHKFGQVPYPAGLILYRKELRTLIEQTIDYLDEKDNTILGSRTGIAAAAIWTMIHRLGIQGFQRLVYKQLDVKKHFLEKMQKSLPQAEIISNDTSLTCGVIFHSMYDHQLPPNIEEKYWLFQSKIKLQFYKNMKSVRIYKFFFLPHMTKGVINQFIKDVQSYA